ncbi:MAG: HAD-IA family hydrolase [Burkholderiales bacterium]|nr:HAD-IA family hydrolase [Burkholderiales bacterium]MCW5603646.1 HAD-IA family hydrolase [Burkholderiales bacterium]
MTAAVLFDLDGTFADTAPDLGHALNLMRAARGLGPVPLSETRRVTSLGARGLLGAGFGIGPGDAGYEAMREEFLRLYADNLCLHSALFPGMAELVDTIEQRGLRWGIVTNKAERFAKPLIEKLGYAHRTGCIIGGDTTGHMKPHPAPLLAGAQAVGAAPGDCVYVGDDLRDIQAGRAAGMRTVAVRFGYLNGSDPDDWQADGIAASPPEIEKFI